MVLWVGGPPDQHPRGATVTLRELAMLLDQPYSSVRHWATRDGFPEPVAKRWNLTLTRLWFMNHGAPRARTWATAVAIEGAAALPFRIALHACCDFDDLVAYQTRILQLIRHAKEETVAPLNLELDIVHRALERVSHGDYPAAGRTMIEIAPGVCVAGAVTPDGLHWVLVSRVSHDAHVGALRDFLLTLPVGALVINGIGRDLGPFVPPGWLETVVPVTGGDLHAWVSLDTLDKLTQNLSQ